MPNFITNKQKILKNFLSICALEGWNEETLKQAITQSELEIENPKTIFSNGIYSLMDFFVDEGNEELRKEAAKIDFSAMKVRDKIKELVKIRILIEAENKNALKSLIAISKGKRIPTLIKNNYKIADLIWQLAADKSTDFNFYTKRLILSKVFARTLIFFACDESRNNEATWNLLHSEIEKVMRIGKIKAQIGSVVTEIKDRVTTACNFKENLSKLPFFRLINPK